jgi:hypothetical protein
MDCRVSGDDGAARLVPGNGEGEPGSQAPAPRVGRDLTQLLGNFRLAAARRVVHSGRPKIIA